MAFIIGNSCNRLIWREFRSTERQIDVTTHKALTRTGQHRFRGRLALGTALAGLAFSYGGRNVYAGTCSGGAGIFSCSGAAAVGPATDSTNGGLGSLLNPGTALIFDFTGALLASSLGWETGIVTIGGAREGLRLREITTETISVSAPSSLPLFATALLGMVGLGRRRRSRSDYRRTRF